MQKMSTADTLNNSVDKVHSEEPIIELQVDAVMPLDESSAMENQTAQTTQDSMIVSSGQQLASSKSSEGNTS